MQSTAVRAGIYCRISKDQTGERLGVDRQQADCTSLAQRLDWPILEHYTDNDISAYAANRPAYRQLLADLRTGHINAVIAWHPDRLYRRVTDLGDLVDVCKTSGTQIATVNAGVVDLTTPTGRLVAGLLAQVAMYEGEHKAERWARSWRQRRELGHWPRTGSRLFGYTPNGEVIEDEADTTRRMATDLLGGVPLLSIARDLEHAGVHTTRGTTWRTGTIRQYLANPRIAGWSTMGGDIVGEGQWEALLDRDTWASVKQLLDGRSRAYAPRKALLNGLIHCALCGHRLISGGHQSGGSGIRTYRCPNRPGMRGCGQLSVNAAPVEEIVESYARTRLLNASTKAAIARRREAPAPAVGDVAALETRINELEAELDRPGTPVPTLLRAIDRARTEQTRLIERNQTRAAYRHVEIPDNPDAWPEDLHRRRALIDLVVERVELGRPGRPSRAGFDPDRVRITPKKIS